MFAKYAGNHFNDYSNYNFLCTRTRIHLNVHTMDVINLLDHRRPSYCISKFFVGEKSVSSVTLMDAVKDSPGCFRLKNINSMYMAYP